MRVKVAIGLRPGVLDPEAVAIERSLKSLGFADAANVRRQKIIELDIAATDEETARAQAKAMCEKLLANPVIESYTIELGGA